MNRISSLVGRATVAVATMLALGACNRAEYAVLPKSPAYLGAKSVAPAPRPAATPEVAVVATPSAAPAASAPVAAQPVAPVAAQPAAVAQVAVLPTAPAKLNLAQRLALHKVAKKLDKLTAHAPQLKQRDAAASTARIDGNLRSGIIFLAVGLIISLFSGISVVFGIIGAILAIIGLVFLLLWLLDQA